MFVIQAHLKSASDLRTKRNALSRQTTRALLLKCKNKSDRQSVRHFLTLCFYFVMALEEYKTRKNPLKTYTFRYRTKKFEKKLKKTLKKDLTKGKRSDRITESPRERGDSTLKTV